VDVRDTVLGIGSWHRFLAHLARLDLPPGPGDPRPVTEEDVASLPDPAHRYMRFMGVVGRPRDWSFRARFGGRIRRAPGRPWMHAVAWQYNTSLAVARVFDVRLDFGGVLPMFGSDTYVGGRGRMLGKALNIVTVVDGSGREFDLGELVTYLTTPAWSRRRCCSTTTSLSTPSMTSRSTSHSPTPATGSAPVSSSAQTEGSSTSARPTAGTRARTGSSMPDGPRRSPDGSPTGAPAPLTRTRRLAPRYG
jgi:hypothetical protein